MPNIWVLVRKQSNLVTLIIAPYYTIYHPPNDCFSVDILSKLEARFCVSKKTFFLLLVVDVVVVALAPRHADAIPGFYPRTVQQSIHLVFVQLLINTFSNCDVIAKRDFGNNFIYLPGSLFGPNPASFLCIFVLFAMGRQVQHKFDYKF